MKLINKYIKPYLGYTAIAVLCIIFDALLEMYLPLLMADIVGKGLEAGDVGYILKIGGIMVLLSFASLLCGMGNAKFSSKAGVGIGGDIRKALFNKVQTFSFKNIDDFSTASLSTRMTNDMTQIQNTLVMGLRMVVRVPIMLTLALIMAIRLNPGLARVFYVVVPLLFIAIIIIAPRAMPMFSMMQTKVDNVNRTVQEDITNVRVVKSFVREEQEKKKFKLVSDDLMNASMRAMNLIITVSPLMILLLNGAIVAVLYLGGKEVIAGIGDAAQLTAFINYIMHVLMSIMMAAMLLIMISRASASFKRVQEVLNTESSLKDSENALKLDSLNGEIEFKNVYFKYNEADKEYILEDISFTASPGQTVAIIGGTGSGKSSLVHLIPRLYDASKGEVLIDGHDVRELSLDTLRRSIGVVLQKNTLFSGTIAENLRWGKKDAADSEIKQAASNAQISDFIESLPDGYDSHVEQGGVNFSGGQKQRLCIARAMIKHPSILIMDDSTSAVDTATERKIWESFRNSLQHTTTLLIAQRISSIMFADKIIVLVNGRIAAQGTHEQLLESSDDYRAIYFSQKDYGKEAV